MDAERAWEITRVVIPSGLEETVILDELRPTVGLELLLVKPIAQVLIAKLAETEVIITGRSKTHRPISS